MYIGTFLGKLFSFREIQSFLSSFSESELQKYGLSEKFICYRCQDCILRWWRIIFDEKKKFVQKNVTSSFLQFGKVFRFFATNLRKACQNFIVHVQTIILGRNYFVWKAHNFFVFSGIRAKCFQSFDDKFSTGWSQMDSTCAEAQFEEN